MKGFAKNILILGVNISVYSKKAHVSTVLLNQALVGSEMGFGKEGGTKSLATHWLKGPSADAGRDSFCDGYIVSLTRSRRQVSGHASEGVSRLV